MTSTRTTASLNQPRAGLTALVVYLRPADRSRILAILTELGIFVLEAAGLEPAVGSLTLGSKSDIVLVFADAEPSHLRVIRELSLAVSPVIVVITPDRATSLFYERSAEFVCASDADPPEALAEALREGARQARRIAEDAASSGPETESARLIQDLEFTLVPPRLARGESVLQLSPAERSVLAALVANRGAPVSSDTLRMRVGGASPASAAYVKSVVLRIRRKIELLGGDPMAIASVRGFGYVLDP